MARILYSTHYILLKTVNYLLFKCYYRFKYSNMMKFRKLFSGFSYSIHIIKFFETELKEGILSSSPHLDNNSVIMDIGGETGVWAMQIYSKYEPNLYIFEPNPLSVKILNEKFGDKKAKILPYGIGCKNFTARLSNRGTGSSIYEYSHDYDRTEKFDIQIRDLTDVFKELSLETIDLMKINIEGGEYDLVPHLIKTGIVEKCKIIRIQFHDWIPNAFCMRKKIVKELSKTHNVEWSYPMVWESWVRKDLAHQKACHAD